MIGLERGKCGVARERTLRVGPSGRREESVSDAAQSAAASDTTPEMFAGLTSFSSQPMTALKSPMLTRINTTVDPIMPTKNSQVMTLMMPCRRAEAMHPLHRLEHFFRISEP